MVARGDAAPAPRRRSLRSQMTVVVAAFIVSALVSGVVALHALQ